MTAKLKFLDPKKAGMRVPKGGSSCQRCMFYHRDGSSRFGKCTNAGFIEWQRSMGADVPDDIPEPADEYCSNWYDWNP